MRKFLSAALMSAIVLSAGSAPTYAADPASEPAASKPAASKIESFYAVLVDTMKQGKSLGLQGRYDKLKPAVATTFNIPAMTQFAVGPSWAKFSAEDQKKLIDAFERMTIANYAKNFGSYNNQTFVVQPNVIDRAPDKVVLSEMRFPQGEPIKFNYRMRDAGKGDWKAIDVFLAGFTSQLALRRSEFANTVETEGAAGLIKKINEVTENSMK